MKRPYQSRINRCMSCQRRGSATCDACYDFDKFAPAQTGIEDYAEAQGY